MTHVLLFLRGPKKEAKKGDFFSIAPRRIKSSAARYALERFSVPLEFNLLLLGGGHVS
jgi:hypothetical protein